MSKRILAIGDIHGCQTALELMLEKLQLTSDDTVISLGDIVDRGSSTRRVIEMLLEVRRTCDFQMIMGNHEEMLLNGLKPDGERDDSLYRVWLNNGGAEVVEEYGALEEMPAEHREFLEAALPYYENSSEIFVHANLQPKVSLEKQTEEWLRWRKLTGFEKPHPSGKRIVCGHTALPEGIPAVFPGWVCIDTAVYRDYGYLTCLNTQTDEVIRTSERGETVSGYSLSDFA